MNETKLCAPYKCDWTLLMTCTIVTESNRGELVGFSKCLTDCYEKYDIKPLTLLNRCFNGGDALQNAKMKCDTDVCNSSTLTDK